VHDGVGQPSRLSDSGVPDTLLDRGTPCKLPLLEHEFAEAHRRLEGVATPELAYPYGQPLLAPQMSYSEIRGWSITCLSLRHTHDDGLPVAAESGTTRVGTQPTEWAFHCAPRSWRDPCCFPVHQWRASIQWGSTADLGTERAHDVRKGKRCGPSRGCVAISCRAWCGAGLWPLTCSHPFFGSCTPRGAAKVPRPCVLVCRCSPALPLKERVSFRSVGERAGVDEQPGRMESGMPMESTFGQTDRRHATEKKKRNEASSREISPAGSQATGAQAISAL
jgi:hypothetical protein